MALYKYTIITRKNDKGEPVSEYSGQRNVDVPKGIGTRIEGVTIEDIMGMKIHEDHVILMGLNPHIAMLETRATEVS